MTRLLSYQPTQENAHSWDCDAMDVCLVYFSYRYL